MIDRYLFVHSETKINTRPQCLLRYLGWSTIALAKSYEY